MSTLLPAGYVLRSPVMADAPGVADLIAARDIADYDSTDANVEEVQNYWEAPRFNLQQDARIIIAPDGLIVGYEEIYPRSEDRLEFDGYVHPREAGRGLGTLLIRWAEERARQRVDELQPSGQVILRGNTASVDQNAGAMFKAERFLLVRQFWRMEIEMTARPDPPVWPKGIIVRAMRLERDERVVYATVEEAFADHWGHVPRSFEDWAQAVVQSDGFDPALTFMAFAGNEVAGVVVNRYRDIAWVWQLAVRRAWRKRGLGLALLLHSFNEFYQRGDRAVGLGVDSQSQTGATRLYEKAGMRVTKRYDTYEKVIRDA
jgi:mycothiol synthase